MVTSVPGGEPPPLYRYRFGTADFDEARFELRVAGQTVEIQRRPLEVLAMLLRHAGELEVALSDYISVHPGRLEGGMIAHPSIHARELTVQDRTRADVVLRDRARHLAWLSANRMRHH